jgi:hypothetical protein
VREKSQRTIAEQRGRPLQKQRAQEKSNMVAASPVHPWPKEQKKGSARGTTGVSSINYAGL